VDALLSDAVKRGEGRPLALIAPNEKLALSGQICADAFRQAAGHDYDVVVLIGGNQGKKDFQGISIFSESGYPTLLGGLSVDADLARRLVRSSSARWTRDLQLAKHSLGPLAPFVRTLFPKVSILPIIMGACDTDGCMEFGKAIARCLTGRRPLIVASTDLSQNADPAIAVRTDRETLRTMAAVSPRRFAAVIPGRAEGVVSHGDKPAGNPRAVLATLAAARRLGASCGHVLSYVHSGETALGQTEEVTGFGAVAFFQDHPCRNGVPPSEKAGFFGPLSLENHQDLVDFARRTLRQYLATGIPPLGRTPDPALSACRGVRVALRRNGRPRGKGVNWEPDRPLLRQVAAQTLRAAFDDPQFPPLAPEELKDIDIEIFVFEPSRRANESQMVPIGRPGGPRRRGNRPASASPARSVEMGLDESPSLARLWEKMGFPQ
jgi:hypothetical protein